MNEIFERVNITDSDRHLGYASVRYPVTENNRIDRYYKKLAEAFIKYAEKKRLCGALNCRIFYEDDEHLSIITESRLYKENNCIRRHRSSYVWSRKNGHLRYLKKWGIRQYNLSYNGRDLVKFD
ncbi:MAG: hypothetical protein IKU19_07970 [Clostridia bacterium]|nr:hypothetical protein [Clostridia bacterium]